MGGTSTDVALVDGDIKVTSEAQIDGLPIRVPVVDIHTVGAGGGSIARLDKGGALRVGPRSAGADPGPACYGQGGTHLTVTDANLLLGRLSPEHFLGGAMPLDVSAARQAGKRLASQLDADVVDLCAGVLTVVNSNMERALKVISLEKGYDPGEFALVSFGGAGSLHACDLARNLGIPKVLIPANPGVLSAYGMAVADLVKTYSQASLGILDDDGFAYVMGAARDLEQRARKDMAGEGVSTAALRLDFAVDLRYRGQSFELTVPLSQDSTASSLAEAFHRRHETRYGYRADEVVERVAVRLRAVIPNQMDVDRRRRQAVQPGAAGSEPIDSAQVYFAGDFSSVPLYDREGLPTDWNEEGPAIIVESHSTIVIPPADRVRVDEFGNLVVAIS